MLALLAMCLSALAAPRLPTLRESIPPVFPPQALEEGLQAEVLLELDIDASGQVVDVRVVESGDPVFDDAATQAARSYLFEPATDARGRPAPATVQYRMRFEPEQAPPVSVQGQVRAAGTRQPLSGLDLVLLRDGQRVIASTDREGRFQVAGLAPGSWTVAVTTPGYRQDPVPITVLPDKTTDIILSPVDDRPWETREEGISEVIEVVGRRVAPEVTERVLTAEEARYLPGTNGDIVRVIQNLPGVARPPLNIGQLLIRGTSPEDSAYYLDGAQIPLVFHFAGFSTVLNGDTIAEIAYLPGNYGVRYGRTLGGVVDIRVDTQLPERSRGYLSVDLFQATAFVQQRLSERTSLTISGRRSYIDAVLNPVLSGLGDATVQAPRFYDAQVRLLHKTAGGGTLDALLLLSDDRFRVVGEDADAVEQVQIGLTTTFQKVRLLSREELGRGWRNEASLIIGPERQGFDLAPDGEAFEAPFTIGLRDEVYRSAPEVRGIGLRAGVDTRIGTYRFAYDIPGFGTPETGETLRLAPAAYVEPTVRWGNLDIIPGLRLDALKLGPDYQASTWDPRIATRLDLGTTLLKATFGGYSQWPQVREALEAGDLVAQRSWQTSAGVEQALGPAVDLELTAFSNELRGLVSGREDAFRFFTGPPPIGPLDTGPYANDGTGRIFGVEALLRFQTPRTVAWLSGTLGRSTRVSRPGEERNLFEYDQPLVLTALGSHQLPRRWRVGARARYGSGNPYTPVVNRYLDLDSRRFRPVYGQRDSARLPPFWQLDVRVDKDWVFRAWTLTAYLDLQNATNAANVEVMAWTFDFSQEDPITQIPVVPAFGLRGEW